MTIKKFMQNDIVYLVVDVKDELPDLNSYYLCKVVPTKFNTNDEAECFFDAINKRWSISPNDRFIEVTHWLKPTSLKQIIEQYEYYQHHPVTDEAIEYFLNNVLKG